MHMQCHTHPKIKDAPKRRRESSHSRSLAASHMAKPKVEPGQPMTPQMTPAHASMATTPTPMSMSMSMNTPQMAMSTPQQSMNTQQPTPIKVMTSMDGLTNMI